VTAVPTTWSKCEKTLITVAKLSPIILAALVVLYIIYYFIKGIYFMLEHKQRINKNWPTYRCKPYVMPFAGWFVGPASTNPASNFVECSFSMHKSFYDVLKQDFITMFTSLSDIVKDQQIAIQDARKMTNFMRNSIKDMARDVYQKIYDSYYRIASLMGVFLGAFGKMFELFSSTYHTLLYAYYTLESVWNGPIGKTTRALEDLVSPIEHVIRFFCFAHDTPILMSDGSYKRASNVQLGDTLGLNAGKVTAYMKIDGKDAEMYKYKNCVTVTGSHLVKSPTEGWIRVCDSIYSRPAKWNGYDIYCFNTTNNIIPAASHMFADYIETNNNDTLSRMQASTLYQLNHKKSISLDAIKPVTVRNQYTWALHGDVMVDIGDNRFKKLSDLQIGDQLAGDNNIVKSVIKVSPGRIELYNYKGDVMSGSQFVLENDMWMEVRDSKIARPVIHTEGIRLYHIVTNTATIILRNGTVVTDFLQSTSEEQSEFIDRYVENIHYKKK